MQVHQVPTELPTRTNGMLGERLSARAASVRALFELARSGVERVPDQGLQRLVPMRALEGTRDDHFAERCRDVEPHIEWTTLVLTPVGLLQNHVAALNQIVRMRQSLGSLLDEGFDCRGWGHAAEGDL